LAQLRDELSRLLDDIEHGDFLDREVAPEMRRLADVAFSGNGEPTTAAEFSDAVELAVAVLDERGLLGKLPVRLITNGSMAHRPSVQSAMARIGAAGGELWFKIDRGTDEEIRAVNGSETSLAVLERNLARCANLAPTWLQTCWFGNVAAGVPAEASVDAYVALVARHRQSLQGVHLYGIARPSMQPGASSLVRLPLAALESVASRLTAMGLTVTTSE
jgi:wyosine [tRNA(Phe)-imidazoG37] synthetase (radical SAM superfamily)